MQKVRPINIFPAWTITTTILAVLILVLSVNQVKQNQSLTRRAESEPRPPLEVKVVNQSEGGFSVSWATIEQTKGYIVYGTNESEVMKNDYQSPKVSDVRGDNAYYVHLATVTGLQAGERYFFKIINNDQAYFLSLDSFWRVTGIPDSVKLPQSSGQKNGALSLEVDAMSDCSGLPDGNLISCYRPNLVWGQVVKPDGQPATDALVYVDIPNKTNMLASVAGSDGRWVINLSNLWQLDGRSYAAYQPGIDLIRLTALGKDTKVSVYQPISSVINLAKPNTSPVSLSLRDAPMVNPVITTTPTATPTQGVNPTPTKVLTPTQPAAANQLVLTLTFQAKKTATLYGTLELKDRLGHWSNVRVAMKSVGDGQYRGTITTTKVGEYDLAFQPDGYLKSNLGRYTLKAGTNTVTNTSLLWMGGDLNKDNRVNILDAGLLLANYAKAKPTLASADLNGDGMINMVDLSILISNYNAVY